MTKAGKKVSDLDKKYDNLLRRNVAEFIKLSGKRFDGKGLHMLDIAPQDHERAGPYFAKALG